MSEDRGRRTGLVLTNAALLYAARAATLVLPLLTIPYLTRCLGVAVWGDVVFAQITGILLSLLIDFGFGWSATREVARWRHDPARLRRIVAGVHVWPRRRPTRACRSLRRASESCNSCIATPTRRCRCLGSPTRAVAAARAVNTCSTS